MLTLFMAAAAALPNSAVEQPPQQPAEKKICRRYIETGSRVKGQTICHTRAEWAQIDDKERSASERVLEQTRLRTLNQGS